VIELRPLSLKETNTRVSEWHRHHKPVRGHKFAVGAFVGGEIAGVAIVGRPSARALDDGLTFELTRLATPENAVPHVASKLIAACWRAARAMGVRKMVSYTRADEPGTCYRAAGWEPVAKVNGREWPGEATDQKRARLFLPGFRKQATEVVDRIRWERSG